MKQQSANNFLRQVLAATMLAVIVGAAIVYYFVDWGYGETSRKGYEYAKALVSICNQKDEARLAEFSDMLRQAGEQKQLNSNELRWLEGIASQASRGNWSAAQRNARRLLLDQVRR